MITLTVKMTEARRQIWLQYGTYFFCPHDFVYFVSKKKLFAGFIVQ